MNTAAILATLATSPRLVAIAAAARGAADRGIYNRDTLQTLAVYAGCNDHTSFAAFDAALVARRSEK